MGTTESVLSEPHRHQGAAAPMEARHHQSSQRRHRPLPPSTTIKPLLKHHGMLLGLPSSGKRTLLQRLEGKDPFALPIADPFVSLDTTNNNINNSSSNKVIVPFQSPSVHWDRIQLQVEIPEQRMNPDADFAVVLVNPQHEPKSVRLYVTKILSLLLQQPGPVALCVLLNFRDQPKHSRTQPHDLQDVLTELLSHHPDRTNVVLQVGSTSLLNCYGLNTLHHFIYRSYLIRKQAEWQEQMLQCQALLQDTAVVPSMEYDEFMGLLHTHPTAVKRRTPELPTTEERRTMGLLRTNKTIASPPILPVVRVDATKALEAFFADSDDDHDDDHDDHDERRKQKHVGPASQRMKLENNDSDDDDDDDGFFYDEGGQRKTAVQASEVLRPAAKVATPNTSTALVAPTVKKPPSSIKQVEAKDKSTRSTTPTATIIQVPVNGKQAREVVAPRKASDGILPIKPSTTKPITVAVKPDLRSEAGPNSDSTLVKEEAKPVAVVAKVEAPPPPIVDDVSAIQSPMGTNDIVPIKDELTTLPKMNGGNQAWNDEEDDDYMIDHKDKVPAQEDEGDALPDSVTNCNPRAFSVDSTVTSTVDCDVEPPAPPNTCALSRVHQQDEGGWSDDDDEEDVLVDDGETATSVLASASVGTNTMQHDGEVFSEQQPVVTIKHSTRMSDESKSDHEQKSSLARVTDAPAADRPQTPADESIVEETLIVGDDSGNDDIDANRRIEPAPLVVETNDKPPQEDIHDDNAIADPPGSDPGLPLEPESPTLSRGRPAQVDNDNGNNTAQAASSYIPTGPLTSFPTPANDSDDDDFLVEAPALSFTKPTDKNGNKNDDDDNGDSDDDFVVEVFSPPVPIVPGSPVNSKRPTGLSVAALAAIAAAEEQAKLMLVEAEAADEEKVKSEKKSKKKKSKEEKAMKKEKKKKSKKSKAVSTNLQVDEGGSDSDW